MKATSFTLTFALALIVLASFPHPAATSAAGLARPSLENPTAAAQAGCSRREALLHLRRTGTISPRSGVGRAVGGRIYRFLCSDFTGDGRSDMAMTISLGGSGAAVYWAVLRRLPSGGLSVGVFRRGTRIGMRLESPTEFAVVEPIIGPNDDFCCEVSGFRYRRFGWDGARFVLRTEEVLPGSTYRDTPAGFY